MTKFDVFFGRFPWHYIYLGIIVAYCVFVVVFTRHNIETVAKKIRDEIESTPERSVEILHEYIKKYPFYPFTSSLRIALILGCVVSGDTENPEIKLQLKKLRAVDILESGPVAEMTVYLLCILRELGCSEEYEMLKTKLKKYSPCFNKIYSIILNPASSCLDISGDGMSEGLRRCVFYRKARYLFLHGESEKALEYAAMLDEKSPEVKLLKEGGYLK